MGRPAVPARGGVRAMTNPQEQFTELTRRTQENFKHLWEQWSQRSNELLKGVTGRSRPTGEAPRVSLTSPPPSARSADPASISVGKAATSAVAAAATVANP